MLLFLRVQMCLLSSVDFLCFACRNDAVWFLYLALKSSSVSPMYVSVVLLSLLVTVAWYSPRLKFPVFFFFFLFFFFPPMCLIDLEASSHNSNNKMVTESSKMHSVF